MRPLNNIESRKSKYFGMLLTLLVPSTSALIGPRRTGILGLLGPDDEDITKGWNLFLGRSGVTLQKN